MRGSLSLTEAQGGAPRRRWSEVLAERVGFEPTVLSHTAFRERHHQPLGHLSVDEDTKGTRGVRAISRRPEQGPRRSASRLRRDGPGLRRGPEQFLRLVATDAADDLDPAQ